MIRIAAANPNLLPENVLVEEGGNYSQNPVMQDISYQWKRLFLMQCQHEFFDASPSIIPRQAINNIQKKKTRERVGYMSAPARGADILVKYIISLDELIL